MYISSSGSPSVAVTYPTLTLAMYCSRMHTRLFAGEFVMPFRPAPGVLSVEMIYSLAGEIVENVYHVMDTGETPDNRDLTTIAQTFETWERNTAAALRTSYCGCIEVKVTDLVSQSGEQYSAGFNPPINGTNSSGPLPGNATLAVKLATTRGSRGSQGRTFWIGFADNMVSANTVTGPSAVGIVSALQSLQAALQADFDGAYTLAVLHSQRNGLPLATRVATPVTGIVLSDLTMDSQKSRLPGHRRKYRRRNP